MFYRGVLIAAATIVVHINCVIEDFLRQKINQSNSHHSYPHGNTNHGNLYPHTSINFVVVVHSFVGGIGHVQDR